MLAYRKWVLSLGIAAVTPGIALAGPLSFFKSDQSATSSPVDNQKLAEEVAANLRAASFSGFDIEIEVKQGICTLSGKIADAVQKEQATRVISRVPGIRGVNNQLAVLNNAKPATQAPVQQLAAAPQQASPIQQAVAENVTSNPIQQAGFFSRERQTKGTKQQAALAQGQPQYQPPAAFPRARRSSESPQQIQQTIARITTAIGQSGVRGHSIDLRYANGVASLIGTAKSADDVARLTQVISKVPGVRQVNNQLQAPGMTAPGLPATGNQQTAERIAQALAANQLSGLDIEVRYNSGVATLSGKVPHPQVAAIAHQVTSTVPGVQQVNNQLLVPGPGQGGPQAGPQFPGGPAAGQPGQLTPVSHQRMIPGNPAMLAAGAAAGAMGMAAGGMGMGPGPGPHGHGAHGPSHLAYDLPNLPNHAWPTYASYPNYAQVAYPQEYSASAWPYIGPFYPYPQVPLGWRQVQLEWDDGAWNLNFRPRTDKWFWYLDPKNW